jgi:mannose-6-phosphate isomerase-like protein (cupin superfamily)
MGRVVTFAQLTPEKSADGVSTAAITHRDLTEMGADFIRIASGKRWAGTVPDGSDCYLFVLNGSGAIATGPARHRLSPQTFATIEERQVFTLDNDGLDPIDIVRVLAPPRPNGGRRFAGFDQKIRVAERAKTPIVDVADQKKRRIYFVGHGAAQSARGHAMIVIYAKDTVTGLHHHPNADSMFVPLDGALQFTVNGKQVRVEPGQVAYFAKNDTHGLHTADGFSGASFLEFHIPAAFTTVRE